MRLNFRAPALAAAILICPVLTTLPIDAVAESPIVHAGFCATLKDMMQYTDAFYERKMTSLTDEDFDGGKEWATSLRVEDSKDCRIINAGSIRPHSFSMYCFIPVLSQTAGQEAYDRVRQVVSDCISEIHPAGLRYGQSTKGINSSQSTDVQFEFEERENNFNVGVGLDDSPHAERSVHIAFRWWRD